ncbi:MAB_1171c family putative transporter [Streptomyces yangpuensis]|uniref:MAB_1171c family putative transporter n=1 Tax=Streptomyces yangpuensis TaxID=1648182 RepID=UPI0006290B78|nr:MAB_1171c family putative transporter [Streptomyces yangpuensis]
MTAIRTLCFAIAAFSSYAALLYRLSQARRSWRDSAYRALIATLLLQCLTFTMGAVAMGGGSLFGIGNLAVLIMHLAAVAFCVAAQIILLRWAATDEAAARGTRYWLITGIVLDVLLTVLFFLADGPGRPMSDFDGTSRPLLLTYLLVFIVSQAVPCVTIYRQCGPYARMTDNASLRQALRMLSVAAVVLFLYCTARTVNILTAAAGVDIGVWKLASNIFSASGIVILSLSLINSLWGPPVSRLAEWARSYRSYRALHPLWRDLYEASPDIALEPPGASVSDLNYRLHRRVVEIRDGWRDLRPYIDRDTHTSDGPGGAAGSGAAGDAGAEARQAFAEAAQIRQALRAKRAGSVPDHSKDAGDFDDRDTDNFMAEVAWLTQVAAAYSKLGKAS